MPRAAAKVPDPTHDLPPLLSLPHELLVQVLRRLDSSSSSSLARASIACSRLRRAAAAARTSINISTGVTYSKTSWQSLLSYLAAQGRHVTHLSAVLSYSSAQFTADVSRSLAALPNLRRLELTTHDLPATLQQLSQVTQLRHLQLWLSRQQACLPAAFAGLQHVPHLTALELRSSNPPSQGPGVVDLHWPRLSSSSIPFLTALSGLQQLVLPRGTDLEPELLSGLPNLQHLDLSDVKPVAPGSTPGTKALLAQLQQFTQLSYLSLTLDGTGVPATDFGAVAASSASALKQLHLSWRSVPQQAWEAMFPADMRLPRLEKLVLNEPKAGTDWRAPGLNAAALSRLVVCCTSSLQALYLTWHSDRAPASVTLDPLQHLTSLTSLTINCVTVQAATNVLPRLTNLKVLKVMPASKLCPAGLMPLTALRQLTSLLVMEKWTRPSELSLTNQALPGAPPDVWQQLPLHILPEEAYAEDLQAELEWLVEVGALQAYEVFGDYYDDYYW